MITVYGTPTDNKMFRDKYGIEWMVDFDPNYKGQI